MRLGGALFESIAAILIRPQAGSYRRRIKKPRAGFPTRGLCNDVRNESYVPSRRIADVVKY